MEKIWYMDQNKKVAEKRQNEELKQAMKQWSDARAWVENEIQRKKEHQNTATNFNDVRKFVRTNWKTKNFDYENANPLEEETSEDEDDLSYYSEEENTKTQEQQRQSQVPINKRNTEYIDEDYGEEDEDANEETEQ